MKEGHKITVSNYAWVHKNDPIAGDWKAICTFPNPEYEQNENMGFSNAGVPRVLRLYVEKEESDWILFPRGLANRILKNSKYYIVDATNAGDLVSIPTRIQLRPTQVPFVDKLEEELKTKMGVIGQAEPGFGKTVCSLELASRLSRKTLILVHKEFLMTQWVERILGTEAAAQKLGLPLTHFGELHEPFLDVTADDVGIIQQDLFEVTGKKIVVAMAQTLLAREEYQHRLESFGTVITDEVHRFAAPTFQQVIVMLGARYRIGVTATPDRKDGMEKVFLSHIGQIEATGEGRKTKPRIEIVKTPVMVNREIKQSKLMRNGKEDYVKVISFLCQHEARNRFIVHNLIRAAKADRKILVLSDRRAHLEDLRTLFLEQCQKESLPFSTTYYVGGMNLEKRKIAEKMQVLLATYAMAKEGLDIPTLDTLFLVTPRADVVQAVGRIMRDVDGKKEPVVMDFVDYQIGLCSGLAAKREWEYRSLKWLDRDRGRLRAAS